MGKPAAKAGPKSKSKKTSKRDSKPNKTFHKEGEALQYHSKDLDSTRCKSCEKDLKSQETAYFVEEDVERVFCSEKCILRHFGPEIDRLEAEYYKTLAENELTAKQKAKYAELRWTTLQNPDEIYMQKNSEGDNVYTLISEYKVDKIRLWSVCVTLFLRGEPSFLFMAFLTKNKSTVDYYRRGEKLDFVRKPNAVPPDPEETQQSAGDASTSEKSDRLALPWTEEESVRAELSNTTRKKTDIPEKEFAKFDACLDETIENPTEVWIVSMGEQQSGSDLIHFIKHYKEVDRPYWYVIVARKLEEDQIEILDAFPTVDPQLVKNYRRGTPEHLLLENPEKVPGKVVH
jgi:hypothetical protein